jgi:hypothetical protein
MTNLLYALVSAVFTLASSAANWSVRNDTHRGETFSNEHYRTKTRLRDKAKAHGCPLMHSQN